MTEAVEIWIKANEAMKRAGPIDGHDAACTVIARALRARDERIAELERALEDMRAKPYPANDPDNDETDTLGAMIDNQAWIVLSHVASRIGQRDGIDFMGAWQDAWADGKVQMGYFSPHRGVAAWIAKHCQLTPEARQALKEKNDVA